MPAWNGQPQKTRYAFTVSGSATVFGAASNNPPVWNSVPHITFFVGITSTFPISGTYQSNNYVTDADFDTIVITKNNVFVQGVNWDGGKFTSNGTGSQTTVTGHILTADDGHNSDVASSPFHIAIIPGAVSWTSVPSVSFVEGSTTPYSLGQNILNYNAATDSFAVTPGFTLPSWLSLSGTGNVNLTPNGNQVDGDDFDDTPGVKIDVRRSGGAWVSSAAFGVTVTAAPVTFGSIDDLAYEGPVATGVSSQVKHSNIQYCPLDSKFYIHGGDGAMNIPGGAPPNSGAIHSVRWTLNASGTDLTEDFYYPYWGYAGEIMPGGAGCNSWQWDNARQCFWSVGGFYEGLDNFRSDPRRVGDAPANQTDARRIWRFDLTGGLAFRWQSPVGTGSGMHGEGHGGVYVPPPIDCFFAFNGDFESRRFTWVNATTFDNGVVTLGLHPVDSPYSGPFPGVTPDNLRDLPQEDPMIYDSVNNEIIWQNHDSNYAGIYATSLANFPGNLTTRQIWRGFDHGGTHSGYGQKPFILRGRKLYTFGVPLNANRDDFGDLQGNGLGIYELDVDTGVMNQGSQPTYELEDFTGVAAANPTEFRIGYMNEGTYSPIADALVASHWYQSGEPARVGTKPLIFKWSPPTWTPIAGELKALTLDSTGVATNLLSSVAATTPPAWPDGGPWDVVDAWGSACYARTLSTNGVLLLRNGGDLNYFGNEVYGFDFDMRKWRRITDPITTPSGNPTNDRALPSGNASYFNFTECEHGPDPGAYGWGLLPVGTQPAVPHSYNGLQWIPGALVGNLRGALVTPIQNTTYTTAVTTRAHYLDLDQVVYRRTQQWGRLSSNEIGNSYSGTTHSAVDEAGERIYHNRGYLNLSTNQQVAHNFESGGIGASISYHSSSCFDPIRRLWIFVHGSGLYAINVGAVGATPANFGSQLTLTGSPTWSTDFATDYVQYAGIVYCPHLDCIFVHNQGFSHAVSGYYTTGQQQVLYRFDPATTSPTTTWNVTKITMDGASLAHVPTCHGTYGRIQWIHPLKCLAIYNNYSGYVHLYKPADV